MPKIKWSENGKPYFESGDINFSISHDGDFCAVMMTDDFADVGIDIQAIPSSTRVLDRLIRRILSKSITPYVREIIEKAPKATVLYHRLTENGIESTRQIECDISGRSGDFLSAWTITEATLKSVGHGLSRFKETEEIIKDAKVGFNIFMDKHGKKYVTCGVVKNINENSPNKRLIL
jgi:phosphopantetheinyl transferase (holo-ACP synthase)